MQSSQPMSAYGYEKISAELKRLKEVERPNIVKEIDVARSHGDLKENAEYHAAKEKQLFIEARISDLSNMLAKAQVIDPATLDHKKVSFGSTVEILNLDTEKKATYTIVGAAESCPQKGFISFSSPIARALLGKTQGEEITIELPKGESDFEILKVYYKPIDFENLVNES